MAHNIWVYDLCSTPKYYHQSHVMHKENDDTYSKLTNSIKQVQNILLFVTNYYKYKNYKLYYILCVL